MIVKRNLYAYCPYYSDQACSGYNCCAEAGCVHARKYQPWLFDGTIERRPVQGFYEIAMLGLEAGIYTPPTMRGRLKEYAQLCARADVLDGKCVGYQKSADNTEPAEMCSVCNIFILNDESEVEP